ncbi:MAG: GGDEF domain-containing protein [Hyphomicrobium sp.]|uniref:GGDEF domain-containing protein n=1 Tax=Hyphomicrobium sp. TaxID=82 RepID=UPI0039E2298B
MSIILGKIFFADFSAMLSLDYHSLLLAMSFSAASLALSFVISWFVTRTNSELLSWATGAAVLAIFVLTYARFVTDFSPTLGMLAFSALLISLMFFFAAARQFRTGKFPAKLMVQAILLSSAVIAIPMFLGYDGVCYILVDTIACALLFATGSEYWRWRKEAPAPLILLSALYIVAGISFALCAAVLIDRRSWIMNRAQNDWATNINLIACLATLTAAGALSLGLNQIRITRRHKLEAETDALTGILNRRALFDRVPEMRTSTPIVVIGLDIDHFKQVNDTHGHSLGDTVLKSFANILSDTVRDEDLTARVGGEEFAVLLPDASLKMANTVAERIRKKFSEQRFLSNGQLFGSTVSVGISQIGTRACLNDLMLQADAALYMAKRSGRNRVVVFSTQDEEMSIKAKPCQTKGESPRSADPSSQEENADVPHAVAARARKSSHS